MSEFILEDEDKVAPTILDWSNAALGTLVLAVAIAAHELPEGGISSARGIEKAGALLGGLTCSLFNGNPMGFLLSLLNKQGELITYCATVEQSQYEDSGKRFGAVIDGQRIETDDGKELLDNIDDGDNITELTIKFGDDK